jgi:hypothetical protein
VLTTATLAWPCCLQKELAAKEEEAKAELLQAASNIEAAEVRSVA